jgi:putative redox protein
VKASAHRTASNGWAHRIETRGHHLVADEPAEQGGEDRGPTPQELLAASLAACTAITIEMYAKRKGWEIGDVEVECEYQQADRESPTLFKLNLRLPSGLSEEQITRLEAIAAKCPVHRTLQGEAVFEQRVELV